MEGRGEGALVKLGKVRQDAMEFNKNVFGNISQRKRKLENRIKRVQEKLNRVDSISFSILERDLQREYVEVLKQEEMFGFHKSNEKWFKFGDRNTSFFYTQTVVHRRRNKVNRLFLSDGSWSTNVDSLKHEALSYFQGFFCSSKDVDTSILSDVSFPLLGDDEIQMLLKLVIKDEVFHALRGMLSFNSSGVDDFQPCFFKHYWHVDCDEVWHLVIDAFLSGFFQSYLN